MNWAQKYRVGARLRMYSGWILFFYATTHLINHSMGIFGLDTLEKAREIFTAFWRLPVLEWLVVTCFVVHVIFVLVKLFRRRTYRGLDGVEWTQIVLGFMILFLGVTHIMETKFANKLLGIEDSYSFLIHWSPAYTWFIFLLVVGLVWVHGTIGIKSYIQQKPWYPRWRPWLAGMAVGLPIFAVWGIMDAIAEVRRLEEDPTWVLELNARSNPQQVDMFAWAESWEYYWLFVFLLFIPVFFLARKVYIDIKKLRKGVLIKYLEGTTISVPLGTTLLEASLQANIPHAHVCGGRGRCSTCRVQVIEGLEELPPPGQDEIALLGRVKSGSSVRLACRTRPVTSCTIYPLLLPNVTLQQSLWKRNPYTGIDRNVAILFADLRGFTALAEDKLPYDVVFVLNQYFQFMGQAIETHQGRIDKFIGDAIMAVFGISRNEKEACRDALAAARSMRFQLNRLNDQLKTELTEPLQIGFGIHFGHVIIGEMGYKDSNNFVAIGDATNTASRLQSVTKDFDAELIVSEEVIRTAEVDFSAYPSHTIEIRGRQRSMHVYAVHDVTHMDI